MLDTDLGELYGVETRVLLQQVKRNANRFPGDFMFQLSAEELDALTSQFVISNSGRGGRRTRPYAFTELAMRMDELEKTTVGKLGEHDAHLAAIFRALRQLMATPPPKRKHPVGFNPPEKN